MPRRRRAATAGLVFHVINRAAKRVALFEGHEDYAAFEQVLASALSRFELIPFAYCLMPNHWHLVLSPQRDGALSRFMHWLTMTHARRWQTHRKLDGQGAVYQGRFKSSAIGQDDHFLRVCCYVERNALRAALVERAEHWPWSSLSRRTSTMETPWLAAWPVSPPVDWLELVNAAQTEAELDALRRALARGEPIGNEAWRSDLAVRFGLSAPGKRGRPRLAICPGVLYK